MKAGGTVLISCAALSVSACASSNVDIRPVVGSKLAASASVDGRVAEGNAMLAAGSVGLAIESFRRALREEPANAAALTGLALSYERIGRFDLASRYYEVALAEVPGDTAILDRLATNREADGKPREAAEIRTEIAARTGAPPVPITLQAPYAATNSIAEQSDVPQPRTAPKAQRVVAVNPTPSPTPVIRVAEVERPIEPEKRPLPVAPPVSPPPRAVVLAPRASEVAPRLVRISHGEIALVTLPGALWERAAPAAVRSARRSPAIRLLNAARVEKLAARTRALMARNGWTDVAVGDAPMVQSVSVIRYPPHARSAALKLAKTYGIAAKADSSVYTITVLLGRDSVRRVGSKAAG